MKGLSNRLWYGLLAAGVIQTAVLGAMVYDRVSLLKSKREIVLEVVPVDPRSLFRGDYVVLRYNISRLDKGLPAEELQRGATLYVTLEKAEDGSWRALKADTAAPALLPGQVMLRGRVESAWRGTGEAGQSVIVRYGIESYFVPEGEGKSLERMVGEKRIAAVVAVDDDGNSAIKGLTVDGQLVHREPLF